MASSQPSNNQEQSTMPAAESNDNGNDNNDSNGASSTNPNPEIDTKPEFNSTTTPLKRPSVSEEELELSFLQASCEVAWNARVKTMPLVTSRSARRRVLRNEMALCRIAGENPRFPASREFFEGRMILLGFEYELWAFEKNRGMLG